MLGLITEDKKRKCKSLTYTVFSDAEGSKGNQGLSWPVVMTHTNTQSHNPKHILKYLIFIHQLLLYMRFKYFHRFQTFSSFFLPHYCVNSDRKSFQTSVPLTYTHIGFQGQASITGKNKQASWSKSPLGLNSVGVCLFRWDQVKHKIWSSYSSLSNRSENLKEPKHCTRFY